MRYNFFPLPHFIIPDSSIADESREISQIKNLKIYVSPKRLFSLNNIYINDVIIENANFNLDNTNYNFFTEILNNKFSNINFEIKKSNIFFRNIDNEVLFINKIKNHKYYYDKNEQKNILYSENEVFNIPYTIKLFNNQKEKKLFSELNFNFIKIKIENELDFKNEKKIRK